MSGDQGKLWKWSPGGNAWKVALICLVALAARLVAWPYSAMVEPDAVNRIFVGWGWMANPHLFTYGNWMPLHYYLIALALWIYPNPAISPVFMHILFAVATIPPLYGFVKNEVGEDAGLIAACLYAVYPVPFWVSLTAMSEVPFAFFLVLALWFLSRARGEDGTWKDALLAGVSLTLAGALRLEAWLLIPLLAVTLYRKPRWVPAFVLVAILFPVFWMVGNYEHYGDPLYPPHANQRWEQQMEGRNDNLSEAVIRQRALEYNAALVFSLTPPVALLALAGAGLALFRRKRWAVWLIPAGGLYFLFFYKTLDGTLAWRPRYTLSMGIMLLLYAAAALTVMFRNRRTAVLAGILAAVLMVPLSYLGSFGPPDLARWVPYDACLVPRIDPAIRDLSVQVNQGLKQTGSGAFICDFSNWVDTYYLAFQTGLHPFKIFIMPGGKHDSLDFIYFGGFLRANPTGLILLADGSRFSADYVRGGSLELPEGIPVNVRLEKVRDLERYSLCRYTLERKGSPVQAGAPSIGWARVSLQGGSEAVDVRLVLQQSQSGGFRRLELTPAPSSGRWEFPVDIRPGSGRNTGMALVNPDSTDVPVTLEFRGADRDLPPVRLARVLPPGGQWMTLLSELLPAGRGDSGAGTVVVHAARPVAALALQLRGEALSMVPLQGSDQSPDSRTDAFRIFPYCAFDWSCQSVLWIQNGGKAPGHVRVDLFLPAGPPPSSSFACAPGGTLEFTLAPAASRRIVFGRDLP